MTGPTRLLILASSLWYFSERLLVPLFAVFSEQVGGDLLDITGAWAAYLIVSGIAYPVVGFIAAYVWFHALFITMGVLRLLATLVQARVSWIEEQHIQLLDAE